MDILKVKKTRLVGKVKVSGAKNAALKLLTASVLTSGKVEIIDSPNGLLDMQIHIAMLEKMGKTCRAEKGYLCIEENKELSNELLWEERSIRNSLLILGSLTTRFYQGKVPLPGGCPLGDRKYDLHVKILELFGAKVWEEEGYLCTKSDGRLKGCNIYLPIRSTGATENAILCASLAVGKTTIWNPHIRPEVLDLIEMLEKMGAKIKVHGQKCIEISGVEKLEGVKHKVVPDNMEAITWAIASAITDGDIEIENFPFEHLEVPLVFLRESGMKYYRGENSLIVRGSVPYPVEISTGPYPGINSDMQPLFAIYGASSQGESKIVDLRFPGRYGYAAELAKMGVNFTIEGDLLKIRGGTPLKGCNVKALDLRAGMALLLAGLIADGDTVIEDAWQIERGYENLTEKLKALSFEIS
ncbi:UDP-N-acetylglucosamine 1-carboxyvinyltransferase [Aliidiomarina taiwanensis]|uniref:UDP-N-acetylglucosamine 1-carboxyvinyltransferase n=1 Tax=Aliidiomarina taiwanensis TaxID=946228 RepID=A0A432WTJ5_9GAMM|nr:UDP-N-acetylglucosamine 1-carboxyvinyltransferase [Aliidiomarina taiwanensis]RUO37100.1 UDP-N-acetylglucosamine 1-carboxyvinyltransferase [Aliidiomarina taiwanensis]